MSEATDQLKADYMREHFARMREIDRRAVDLTAGLAIFNARQIFFLSNAQAHPDARLPQEAIDNLTELLSSQTGTSSDE